MYPIRDPKPLREEIAHMVRTEKSAVASHPGLDLPASHPGAANEGDVWLSI